MTQRGTLFVYPGHVPTLFHPVILKHLYGKI